MPKYQVITELTEEFFRSTLVPVEPADTYRAVIPTPRTPDEVIRDEIHYNVSTMTVALRTELRAEIEQTKTELTAMQAERAAMRAERQAMSTQHAMIAADCADVAHARQLLANELEGMRLERHRMYELYRRVCLANGLCTPSRQNMTGW